MSDMDIPLGKPNPDLPILRDQFAMAALPTIIDLCVNDSRPPGMNREDYFAMKAYAIADAMLKARAK